MDRFIRWVDGLTEAIGRSVSWLVLLMTAVTCLVVVLRYGFSVGSIALQESVIYLHGLVFMLGIPYALKHDAHVRVDVLHSRWSARKQRRIELGGTLLLLLPFAVMVLLVSLLPAVQSWQIWEQSPDPNGLPRYWIKSLIPLGFGLLALQGLAQALRLRRER